MDLPGIVATRAASTIHTNLMVSFHFDVMSSFGEQEAVLLGAACPPGLPLQQGALGAFAPLGKIIFFRTIMHPMDIQLNRARQLLFAEPLSGSVGALNVSTDSLRGEAIRLRVPLPVSVGEANISRLIKREVRLDPTDLLKLVYMPSNITPIVGMFATGVDGGAILYRFGHFTNIGIVGHERQGPRRSLQRDRQRGDLRSLRCLSVAR